MEANKLLASAGIAMAFATASAVAQPPPGFYGGALRPGQITGFGSSRPTQGYSPLSGSGVPFGYGGAYSSNPYGGYSSGYSSYPREVPYGGYSSYPREMPYGSGYGYSSAPREVPLGGGYGRTTYGGEIPRGYYEAPLVEGLPLGYGAIPVERVLPQFAQVVPQPAPQQPARQVPTQQSEVSLPKGFTAIQDRLGSTTTAINDQPVPTGAVGYRLDSKIPGGIQWSYRNGTTTPEVLAKAPKIVETTVPAVVKAKLEYDFVDLTKKLQTAAVIPDAVKKNRTEAIAQHIGTRLELDVAPVGVDADDTKAVDEWVQQQNANKATALQALYLLAKPATVAALKGKQELWFGHCTVPWIENREDAGTFALYPDGDSASVVHVPGVYNQKDKSFYDGQAFSTVASLTAAEAGAMNSSIFEVRNDFSKLKDVDGEVQIDKQEPSTNFGGAVRIRVRRLTVGKISALATRVIVQKDGRGSWYPVSHCLFTTRWQF